MADWRAGLLVLLGLILVLRPDDVITRYFHALVTTQPPEKVEFSKTYFKFMRASGAIFILIGIGIIAVNL